MAKKTDAQIRRELEEKITKKVDRGVYVLTKVQDIKDEQLITSAVIGKFLSEAKTTEERAVLLEVLVKKSKAYNQLQETIKERVAEEHGSDTNYKSASKTANAIRIADTFYQAEEKRSCRLQKECVRIITPKVQAIVRPSVRKLTTAQLESLKNSCESAFVSERHLRTRDSEQVIQFINMDDFVRSTIRASFDDALINILDARKEKESAETTEAE